MTQTVMPLVKLYVANSYYYDCGMLLMNSVVLPTEENKIREMLKEIQVEDDKGYIVLRGETQLKCNISENLDIFELNRKLKACIKKSIRILPGLNPSEKYSNAS